MTTNHDNGTYQLPDYRITTGEAPSIEHVAWLGEGDFCRCYLVNGRMVVRYANHAQASAALLRETCLLPILAQQLGTTVPALAFVGHVEASGHGLMGYPLLPGTVLEREILDSLPPAHQDLLLAQLASLVRRLHMLPLAQVSPCEVPQLHPASYLSDVLARARRILWPHLTAPPDSITKRSWRSISASRYCTATSPRCSTATCRLIMSWQIWWNCA